MVAHRRADRLRRARAAADPRPVRQARRRAAGLRRPEHLPAAARQHGRRHPDHLRDLDPPAAGLPGAALGRGLDEEGRPSSLGHGAAALRPALRASGSSSSATSTRRSSSTRPTPPTTCASTAASSRASGPGKKTADYIDTVLSRLTIVGAVYLTVVALLPDFLDERLQGAGRCPGSGRGSTRSCRSSSRRASAFNFYFGGTSLLIVVGVAMDTVQQVESQARRAPLHRVPEEEPDPGAAQADARRLSRAPGQRQGHPGQARSRSGWPFPHISTGDILRDASADGTPLGTAGRRPSWRRASSSPTS